MYFVFLNAQLILWYCNVSLWLGNGQTSDFVPLHAFCIANSRLPVLERDPLAATDVLSGSTVCRGPERFKVVWQEWVKWRPFAVQTKGWKHNQYSSWWIGIKMYGSYTYFEVFRMNALNNFSTFPCLQKYISNFKNIYNYCLRKY